MKPIRGSWFEFQHHSEVEGVYWNRELAQFTAEQWGQKVKEMADIGMEYLVLSSVALNGKAFFDTDLCPSSDINCADPLEVVLSAADKYGIKFFISNDYFGRWQEQKKMISDPVVEPWRIKAMEQLTRDYYHHESFYGWFWPNEARIIGYYDEAVINYVNRCSAVAHSLTPDAKILIAPYGTKMIHEDCKFLKQLERLDVDIIAYQDEIGVRKAKAEHTSFIFESLRRIHDKVPQRKLWADMEIYEFEGEVYNSALVPAEFSRIRKQMSSISDFVDTILVYMFPGLMNPPQSSAFAGHPDSSRLYSDYVGWLQSAHPEILKRTVEV